MAVLTSAALRPTLAVLVAALTATAGAGCYQPTAVDCQVSCEDPGDCLSGQVCDDDGRCTAPETANMCDLSEDPDARIDGADSDPADAGDSDPDDAGDDPPDAAIDAAVPDAGMPVVIVVSIAGRGSVRDSNGDVCLEGKSPCPVEVNVGQALTWIADPGNGGYEFDAWSGACAAETTEICRFTATAQTVQVGVTFSR